MKRYKRERGSEAVQEAMAGSRRWLTCRIAFLETSRALALACGKDSDERARFLAEWRSFTVIEVDQPLAESAVDLAVEHGLRSLDSLHLAAAALAGAEGTGCATFDRRLWAAAAGLGFRMLPERSPR